MDLIKELVVDPSVDVNAATLNGLTATHYASEYLVIHIIIHSVYIVLWGTQEAFQVLLRSGKSKLINIETLLIFLSNKPNQDPAISISGLINSS